MKNNEYIKQTHNVEKKQKDLTFTEQKHYLKPHKHKKLARPLEHLCKYS